MKKPPKLSLIFLESMSSRVNVPDNFSEFEELLRRAIEVGRNRWPQLALPAEVFVRYLAERVPSAKEESSLEQLLEEMHLDDLYLACACMQRVPKAIPNLEHYCLAKLRSSFKQPSPLLDDVCQNVRIHLLLGTTQAGPQLSAYKGRGSLPSWVRVIAVNMLVKAQAAPDSETLDENVFAILENLPTPAPDAELDLIKNRFRQDFRQALHEAFFALSREQRNLLRFYFIDRLTTTELGKVFLVDQSTVSRWLKHTRNEVYEGTKRRLLEHLRLSSQEFESLLDSIKSRFDLSLSQIMEEEDEGRSTIPSSCPAPSGQGECI